MNNTFKPGDIVKLNSGGPWMTIDWIEDKSQIRKYHCFWFNKVGDRYELESGCFAEGVLTKKEEININQNPVRDCLGEKLI